MPNPVVSRLRLNSLRGRLLLLVLLALAPPMVLNLTGAWHERGRELKAARADLQRMADMAAANEERFIEGGRQFLVTLADVPELRREPARCSAFLNSLLRKNDDYLNLGLIDPDGQIRCSARPTPHSVNVRDRDYFRRALTQRGFVAGNYIYGRLFGMHTLNLTYPLLDGGKVRGVLFASIRLQALDRFARDIDLPEDAVMVTADRDGTVLSQRPDVRQRRVGKPADGILRAAVRAQEAPIAETFDADGIARLYAFAKVRTGDGPDFMLSVAMPRNAVVATADRQQALEFLTLLLTAVLVLGATWLVGDVMIVRRIQALARAVGRIADGDLAARSGVRGGGAELDRLGRAVDRMALTLQEHERARNAAQARLFEEKERAQVTLASIGDAVITTDRHGRIEYMNPVAETLTGWPYAAGRGQPLAEVFQTVSQHNRAPVPNPVEQALREGSVVTLDKDALLIARDGSEYAVEDSAAPIRDREQVMIGAVLVFRDVSKSRSLAVQLSHQASHDPLTGLVNRREFERRLQRALEAAAGQERHYSVLYMDLDQFKIVNDTCGHGAGDDLLRQVTVLLQPLLRESDTLARLGGDEFGALLENCTPDAAAQIADKLRQTICDFHFVWRDRMFYIGVSIGIVNFNSALLSLEEVLSAADSACYLAKEHGRNRLHVYHPEDDELVQRHGQMEWTGRIQRAFHEDRLRLYRQRITAIGGDDGGEHHELLLRMVGENGEIIPPMAFIPAAERYGLMPEIDRWVIRTAFARCAELSAAADGGPVPMLSINLSGASLNDGKFLDFVCRQFREFGIPFGGICFEITETTAIANLNKAIHFMRELRQLGCRFSLDDFGSGMSSFAYLKHLPVDFLKIDGGFVADIAHNPIDRAMVAAIHHVGHVMGIRTVAEGVENDATLAELRAIGVDYVQGYAVAPLQPF